MHCVSMMRSLARLKCRLASLVRLETLKKLAGNTKEIDEYSTSRIFHIFKIEEVLARQTKEKCNLDSEIPAVDDLSVPLFDTVEACCEEKITWKTATECNVDSTGSSTSACRYSRLLC